MANRPLNKDGTKAPVHGDTRAIDDQFKLAQSFADATTDAVLLCDRSGQIQHANPTAQQLFETGEGFLTHTNLHALIPDCPDELMHDAPGYN